MGSSLPLTLVHLHDYLSSDEGLIAGWMTASLSTCLLSYEFRQHPVQMALLTTSAGVVGYSVINYIVPTEVRFVVVSLLFGLTAYQIRNSLSTDTLGDSKTMDNQEHKDPRITCQFVDMKQLQGVVSDHILQISPEGSKSLIDTIKNAAGEEKCGSALQHIAQAEDSIRSVCEYLAPKRFDGVYFNDRSYKNNNVFFVQEDAKLILLITIDRRS